jgi:seryl-tRNA synthetase
MASTHRNEAGVDPVEKLLNSKDLHELGSGSFAYFGFFANLLQKIDSFFLNIAIQDGASPFLCPSTLPVEDLIACDYVTSFPHHLRFISDVIPGGNSLDSIRNWNGLSDIPSSNNVPREILSPTVCHFLFSSLRNNSYHQKMKTYTSVAACHRNEGSRIKALARQNTFRMREFVALGPNDSILEWRKSALEQSRDLFNRWQLNFRVAVASDPFFGPEGIQKQVFQSFRQSKYELELFLPHQRNWIAGASFNNHQNKLCKDFHIGNSENWSHSACAAFGLERIALALLSQFGMTPTNWPTTLKEDLNFS